MKNDFEARVAVGDVVISDRDIQLLRGIDKMGSIHAAANQLGRSYAHAQRRIVELEREVGSLVDRQRGGSGGGGSQLTPLARSVIRRFERLSVAYTGVAGVQETTVSGEVVDRDGELATVDTAIGSIRAIVPEMSDRVQLSIKSDAVTLMDPGDSPTPHGTSARNSFSGTISNVEMGSAVGTATVDVDDEIEFKALITASSLDFLSLTPGREVIATFKATATRGIPLR